VRRDTKERHKSLNQWAKCQNQDLNTMPSDLEVGAQPID